MQRLLLVAACLICSATWASGRSCPSVKVLDSLDLKRYPGIWFEVASQNLAFLSSCKCSVYNFTCTTETCSTFDDRFTCNKDVSKPGSLYDLVLKGKIPDLNVPAKMEESPIKPWLPSAPCVCRTYCMRACTPTDMCKDMCIGMCLGKCMDMWRRARRLADGHAPRYWVIEVGQDYDYAVVYACVGALGLSQVPHCLARTRNFCMGPVHDELPLVGPTKNPRYLAAPAMDTPPQSGAQLLMTERMSFS